VNAGWRRRFAVHGVFWREYLDWAIFNVPFYLHHVLLCYWTLFFFFFAWPARRAIVANLRIVLPGSSAWSNHLRAFRTLYNFAWSIADAATYRLTQASFRFDVSGEAFLQQLAEARGAIVLTAHMGSYDLGAALFAQKFRRTLRMVRAPEPDTESEQHLRKSLDKSGAGALQVNYNTAGALLSFDLLSALRRGEIVSIQGDRPLGQVAQVETKMFGADVQVPAGPFILALTAGVPIHPLFIVRNSHRRYGIIAGKPILLQRGSGARERDIMPAVQQWIRTLEAVVQDHWAQWFAFAPLFTNHARV
jgi:lauroyl/myristoyl acyltransferase